MRLTQKRNGKNVIPLLMAVCGIDLPYWRIDKAGDLQSYLSGDSADKLAAYEDAEEQGRLVILPCKVGDKVYRVQYVGDSKSPSGYTLGVAEIQFSLIFLGEVGKTVFLTRAEAEAALKGETDNGTT